jgi:ligand-binding SRPBCC domain-containing protein
MWHFYRSTLDLNLPIEQVFEFFCRAENLERITPPSLGFKILTSLPIEMKQDAVIDYRIRLHGIPMRWRTLISVWNPPFEFVDEQIKGPYLSWIHRHSFQRIGDSSTRMTDYVRYRLPFTPAGDIIYPLIKREVEGIFHYRNEKIPELLHPAAARMESAAGGSPATLEVPRAAARK